MYVYFILSYIAVKIGKAENVEERRENLQTANPDELIIHRKIRIPENISAKTVETALHKLAEKYHKRGEWFYLNCLETLDKMSDEEIISLGQPISDDQDNLKTGRKRVEEHYGMNIHNKILNLHEQGLSYRKISEVLGVSIATICRSIKEKRGHNI